MTRMNLAALFLASFVLSSTYCAPFDTSNFGVYRSEAAQNYFASRFGSGFLSSLGAKLRGLTSKSSSSSSSRTARLHQEEQQRPSIVFITEAPVKAEVKTEEDASEQIIYRDAIAPQTSMNAEHVESFKQENPNHNDVEYEYYYYYDDDLPANSNSNSIDYYGLDEDNEI